jgi:hypothetical protein
MIRLFFHPLLGLLLCALLIPSLQAQPVGTATLTGTVVDEETGEPLVGANVFIAVSMIGTATDAQGRYRLERVPLGAHRLYVSMLGYEPALLDLMLREARVHPFNFRLKPTIIEGAEVTVEAERDKNWQRRLEKFTRLFIGETPNAQMTKILNPEVMDFTEKLGEFRATASAPLVIENRALGYKVQYFLKEFVAEPTRTRYDGEPLFEEMTPESPEQAQFWKQQRDAAFMGSFRHFALALLAGRVEGQGFMVYSRPSATMASSDNVLRGGGLLQGGGRAPLDPKTILREGTTPNEKVLDFRGFVEIIFTGEMEDESYQSWQQRGGWSRQKYQTSWIELSNGPAVIDYKGDVLDPYGITFYGYLAFERVADEVPKEYRPGQ